jgi:DNA-binding MarR family transcriptional regulator
MDATVLAIQQFYPQVFHACHVRHERRRSNAFRLSERDSSILAHVSSDWTVTARDLGRHFGLGAPTLSDALRRLERLGYVAREPRNGRSPARPLRLTTLGREALQATSVLDAGRLTTLLEHLTTRERATAVAGLRLLARGARSLANQECRP